MKRLSLTRRLLTLQSDLLEPTPDDAPARRGGGEVSSEVLSEVAVGSRGAGRAGGQRGENVVENVVLHRNQLETAALATAALGGIPT